MQSESIDQLATALAIAQGKITGALKDSQNPFYKSRYADLASVWDACRDHLSANGLCVIQTTEGIDAGVTVVTTLAHKSGQWIRGVLAMTPKDSSPQAVGSCMTYARRYALAAIVGVAQIDDDGNAATRSFSDRSGKPETDGVDQELRDQYADGLKVALLNANSAKVLELHDELRTQAELYTSVGEKLSSKQRADLRAIISARPKLIATPIT